MRQALLKLTALCATLLAPLALHTPLAQAAPVVAAPANARVIVKYKVSSTLGRMQALSASAVNVTALQATRATALGQRVGLALQAGGSVDDRTHVVFASGLNSEQLAERLSADAEVEYAVPDHRRHKEVAPNDSYYARIPGTLPAAGQWYLRASNNIEKSAINAEAAWAVTTGSSSLVVAVLDTGVRFEHPDLLKLAKGGNFLDGYDMISDPATANDGGGRDADASDPGDWVTSGEAATSQYANCLVEGSSWHGTATSSLIGALTNNGVGIASVGRNVRILPVRVLGKCGGFDSDIAAGMRWAAGLSVPGVPNNLNPAQVINLSLGGSTACEPVYVSAIHDISVTVNNPVIVASAGNGTGHAVNSPANCAGVIAVSGVRHAGTKVGYSDIGPEAAISAPGGNCVNDTGECLYPIVTASNLGVDVPSTSSYDPYAVGTSFSAPLVAGTAALMLSANPALTPAQVKAVLQLRATPFPTSGAGSWPQCTVPTTTSADQSECYCTTSTCGAGMLNAGAALNEVLAEVGLVANITVLTANPTKGQPVQLSAADSTFLSPFFAAGWNWEVTSSGGIVTTFSSSANAETATITPTAGGRFTVKLTVTDNQGFQSSTTSNIYVPGAVDPTPAPATDTGGGGALGGVWLLLLGLAVLALRRTPRQIG